MCTVHGVSAFPESLHQRCLQAPCFHDAEQHILAEVCLWASSLPPLPVGWACRDFASGHTALPSPELGPLSILIP